MKKLLLLFLLPLSCFAQALDPTFSGGSSGYQQNIGEYGIWTDDGKLVTQSFDVGYPLRKYNDDGSLDTSFAEVSFNGVIDRFFKGANNKFGGFNTASNEIFFFNQSGSVITGFTQPNLDGMLWNVLWQADGKVMIVGDFTTVNGFSYKGIARLNVDGSLDTTFNIGSGASDIVYCVAQQSDGKYVVGGDFTTFNGTTKIHLTRLNANGSIDTGFYAYTATNNCPYAGVRNVEIQADGKIVISGCGFISGSSLVSKSVVRLLTDGTRDTSFACTISTLNPMEEFLILPSGKYLAYAASEHILYRLNSTGTLDNTFTYNNTNINVNVNFLQNVTGSKIFINSSYTSSTGVNRLNMHRINADGTIDLTFHPQPSFNGNCSTLKVLRNNKIIVGGNFTTYSEVSTGPLCRLTENGNLDTAFVKDSQITFNGLLSIKEQVDAKLLIGPDPSNSSNSFVRVNSTNKQIIRISANGALDTTFNVPGTVTNLLDFEILNDEKVLVAAYYSGGYKILRLNSDGSLDSGFTPVSAYDATARLFKFADGSLFKVTDTSSGDTERVFKLNADGTVDTSFNCFLNRVTGVDRQADGMYLVSYYSDWTGVRKVARITYTGAVDAGFTTITKNTPYMGYDPLFVNSENKIFVFRVGAFAPRGVDIFDSNGVFQQTVAGDYLDLMDRQGCDNVLMALSDIKRYKIFTGTITPPPTGTSPQAFVADYTLANLVVTGANIQWYTSQPACSLNIMQRPGNVNVTNDVALPLTTPLVNGTIYYASQTLGGIESTYRLPILVGSALDVNDSKNEPFRIINPVRSNIEIYSFEPFSKVAVYSLSGVKLLESSFQNDTYTAINFEKFSTGLYIIRIETEKGTFSKKIIKE